MVQQVADDDRAAMKARLTEFDAQAAAIEVLRKPRLDAMKPYDQALAKIDEDRELYLEGLGAEHIGNCDVCGRVMLSGDQGSIPFVDEHIVYCAEHSWTYADLREHWAATDPADDDEDHAEMRRGALAMIAAREASGEPLTTPITHTL